MARGREKKAENEQRGNRRRERERVEAKDKRAIRFRDGWKRVRDGDEIRRDAQRFG